MKDFAMIDVTCIAVGFVMRVLVGGVATGIWVSQWLVLMTFLLSSFLALSKRYDDVFLSHDQDSLLRKSITGYNVSFISIIMAIYAAVTIVCYIMYTMSEEVTLRFATSNVYLTSIWVICGISRYLQIMVVYRRSSSPTQIMMNDFFMQFCLLGWLLSFVVIIYL